MPRKNDVIITLATTAHFRDSATLTAQKNGYSVRQFLLNALACAVEDELDITLGEVIDRAKEATDPREIYKKRKKASE